MKPSELKVKIKCKLRAYFYFKLYTLYFFSYFFDVSKWQMNLVNDIQNNVSRYFKIKTEPSGGGGHDLSDSE